MKPTYTFFLVFIGLLVVAWFATKWGHGPARVDDVWIINLDRAPDRWAHMKKATARFGDRVHRFAAADGKQINDPRGIHAEGVGYYFTRVAGKKDGELVNKGVVGCWLSHKRLLTLLAQQPMSGGAGHLVLEDDVDIPDDFLSGTDRWSILARNVPEDWDIVYLGMSEGAKGQPVAHGVVKLSPGPQQWGTYAYLVKHDSVKNKILPALRFMTDAIDEQYNTLFGDLNVYCLRPSVIHPNMSLGAVSSITN
jgi:GR25 family glycosyltransferase involved in LPS biosynthesis